jgi:hypothetical protein
MKLIPALDRRLRNNGSTENRDLVLINECRDLILGQKYAIGQ